MERAEDREPRNHEPGAALKRQRRRVEGEYPFVRVLLSRVDARDDAPAGQVAHWRDVVPVGEEDKVVREDHVL